MKVQHGKGKTIYGPGVEIILTSNEIATAIDAYLVARRVCVVGPRTITITEPDEGAATCSAQIYVDPSGFVIRKGTKFDGRGEIS